MHEVRDSQDEVNDDLNCALRTSNAN